MKDWQKQNMSGSGYVNKLLFNITVLSTVFLLALSGQNCFAIEEINYFDCCWQQLKCDPAKSLSQSFGVYHLKTTNGSRATLIVLDLNDRTYILKSFFNEHPKTVAEVVKEHQAIAGINGGFFNLSNSESTSYVIIDGKNQCDPKTNKALINNPDLAPYLNTIFNRSEFRIFSTKNGKIKACIVPHDKPIPEDSTLLQSLQAGPSLLPDLRDKEEAFVRNLPNGQIFDSINAKKKVARTAIGITRDNHVLLLVIADKKHDCFSAGVTIDELAQMMRTLGCEQALNCDGGTSTTMVLINEDSRDPKNYRLHKEICAEPEKLVKSGLLILKNIKSQKQRSPLNNFAN